MGRDTDPEVRLLKGAADPGRLAVLRRLRCEGSVAALTRLAPGGRHSVRSARSRAQRQATHATSSHVCAPSAVCS
jgi:hypothetical protein